MTDTTMTNTAEVMIEEVIENITKPKANTMVSIVNMLKELLTILQVSNVYNKELSFVKIISWLGLNYSDKFFKKIFIRSNAA